MELRPAQTTDILRIVDLCQEIWGGGDYLPGIIGDWISQGGVYVGIVNEKIIGVSRIRQLKPDQWWLEGLRIDPAEQGHGFGRELHNMTLAELKRIGKGTVRFATADTNHSISAALKSGFKEVLCLPFTYHELSHQNEPNQEWRTLFSHHGINLNPPHCAALKVFLKQACQQDYAGLLRHGWEFLPCNEINIEEWLAQSTLVVAGDSDEIIAVAVLAPDRQRRKNFDINLISGPPAIISGRIIPCLVAVALKQPTEFQTLHGCVPTKYMDSFKAAGYNTSEFFTYQLIYEAQIAELKPAV